MESTANNCSMRLATRSCLPSRSDKLREEELLANEANGQCPRFEPLATVNPAAGHAGVSRRRFVSHLGQVQPATGLCIVKARVARGGPG